MITRTETFIELGNGDKRLLAFDAAGIEQSMLSAERRPCGAICHVLALTFADGHAPVRLEGGITELREVHAIVMEIMLETAPPRRTVH